MTSGTREAAIDADLPIIDPHHHLWLHSPTPHYPEFPVERLVETVRDSGHKIVATVYLEAGSAYLTDGPAHLRGTGETVYVRDAARRVEGSGIDVARGIVTNVDLELDAALLDEQLDAHIRLGEGRLRGVRKMSAWDEAPELRFEGFSLKPGALREPAIHRALRQVAVKGLSFDAWMHFPQLGDLVAAADAVPELEIALDHLGGVVLIGPYAGRSDEVFAAWAASIDALAARPNVTMKIGGLFMGPGRQFDPKTGSAGLADLCRPWFDHLIDRFGAGRCMFESNFPVDGAHLDYGVLWNTFKRYAQGCSAEERHALFFGTADRVYRLGLGGAAA